MCHIHSTPNIPAPVVENSKANVYLYIPTLNSYTLYFTPQHLVVQDSHYFALLFKKRFIYTYDRDTIKHQLDQLLHLNAAYTCISLNNITQGSICL